MGIAESSVCKCGGVYIFTEEGKNDCSGRYNGNICGSWSKKRCNSCKKYWCGSKLCGKHILIAKPNIMWNVRKPFSEGACRYAFMGQRREVDDDNDTYDNVVIKKFKDKTAYNRSDWKGDIKCYDKASELIDSWNKLGLINKKYIMHKPLLIQTGLVGGSMTIPGSKHCPCEDEKKPEIEEYVLVEEFLEGNYEKWNSNSGWCLNSSMSIQAFCHWTYHYSRGNL
eukprot:81437_1